MAQQRFEIGGVVYGADDQRLQAVLARAQDAPARPRCLCVPAGVPMYVAHHRQWLVKRMPDTGELHHPACPSYEPAATACGLGELLGEAVVPIDPVQVELRTAFAWTLAAGRAPAVGEARDTPEVRRARRRLSLRGLMHFLFDRAGFNRWSPAMAGKRHQGVVQWYLMAAADGVQVRGEPLTARLYVPELFSEARKAELVAHRREVFRRLMPHEGATPLMVVIGEFKACEASATGRWVWIRHMPDSPLRVEPATWSRIERGFASLFEARDADGQHDLKLVLAALVRARHEQVLALEAASVMLTTRDWIPVDGLHELPLLQALVAQRRRFLKPLRYEARSAAGFANALLLDAGAAPIPLHVLSPFMMAAERLAKERVVKAEAGCWVWDTAEAMPSLPAAPSAPSGPFAPSGLSGPSALTVAG